MTQKQKPGTRSDKDFLGALEQADKRTRKDGAPGVFGHVPRGNTRVGPGTIQALDEGLQRSVKKLEDGVGSMAGAVSDKALADGKKHGAASPAAQARTDTEARKGEQGNGDLHVSSGLLKHVQTMQKIAVVAAIQRLASMLVTELNQALSDGDILFLSKIAPYTKTKLKNLQEKLGEMLKQLGEKEYDRVQELVDATKIAKTGAFRLLIKELRRYTQVQISKVQSAVETMAEYCPEKLKGELRKLKKDIRLAQITMGDPNNTARQDEKGGKA